MLTPLWSAEEQLEQKRSELRQMREAQKARAALLKDSAGDEE